MRSRGHFGLGAPPGIAPLRSQRSKIEVLAFCSREEPSNVLGVVADNVGLLPNRKLGH